MRTLIFQWMMFSRKPHPSGVLDEEWVRVAPYPTLWLEDAEQREHALREMFNELRYVVKTGAPWRSRAESDTT